MVQYYDRLGQRVEELNLNFLRQEIALRDFEEQNGQLIKMTNHIRFLTVVVTFATILNVIVFVVRG